VNVTSVQKPIRAAGQLILAASLLANAAMANDLTNTSPGSLVTAATNQSVAQLPNITVIGR
jgi:hypothetical protein